MNSFYSEEELEDFGFKRVGKNVLLSRKASIYAAEKIEIGDNVRIDDFCILSGKIKLGNNIHISAYTALYGQYGILVEDYATISGRNMIYSATDDYSGEYMTNPTNNQSQINVVGGPVIIRKHAIIGAGCVVMPNLVLEEGSAIGAMSFVNKSTEPWSMYVGVPIKKIKDRSKRLLDRI